MPAAKQGKYCEVEMEGLEKKDLEAKRSKLVMTIAELIISEKAASERMHQAISEKIQLKSKIIGSKNYLVQLDVLISECAELKLTGVVVR